MSTISDVLTMLFQAGDGIRRTTAQANIIGAMTDGTATRAARTASGADAKMAAMVTHMAQLVRPGDSAAPPPVSVPGHGGDHTAHMVRAADAIARGMDHVTRVAHGGVAALKNNGMAALKNSGMAALKNSGMAALAPGGGPAPGAVGGDAPTLGAEAGGAWKAGAAHTAGPASTANDGAAHRMLSMTTRLTAAWDGIAAGMRARTANAMGTSAPTGGGLRPGPGTLADGLRMRLDAALDIFGGAPAMMAAGTIAAANRAPVNAMSAAAVSNSHNHARSNKVTIGQITVATQAIDADGIGKTIGDSLQGQLQQANDHFDNGISY